MNYVALKGIHKKRFVLVIFNWLKTIFVLHKNQWHSLFLSGTKMVFGRFENNQHNLGLWSRKHHRIFTTKTEQN
jgi:hypothetical protein